MSNTPIIGISSCLLGDAVRYDGGHKRDRWLSETLGRHVRFKRFCPEVAIGMGTPRDPIQLVGSAAAYQARGVKDPGIDVTAPLSEYGRLTATRHTGLSGFIFKSKSPSCGMERVRVRDTHGAPFKVGIGLFAREIMQARPYLPVEEEGRLNDAVLRENFVNRVFAYQRWQQLRKGRHSAAALVEFHARHKYLVMSHSQAAYRRLGQLVARQQTMASDELYAQYEAEFMTALKRRVSRGRHVNTLQHIQGYLKRRIDADDKAELVACVGAYQREEIPLVAVITLFRHYFRRHPDDYIDNQWYLQPCPDALGLRNAL